MFLKNKINNKKGFAMLFAVLTASILITIGLSIFNISFKELLISTNARESQVAFFAADSARECALYWDIKKGAFPICKDNNNGCDNPLFGVDVVSLNTIKCNGGISELTRQNTSAENKSVYTSDSESSFVKYGNGGDLDPEADVVITKTYSQGNIITDIEATGHNVLLSGRRLERAIRQTSIE